jgi:Arc/MetJ-type ribon-helix-helix transcriptional regulator
MSLVRKEASPPPNKPFKRIGGERRPLPGELHVNCQKIMGIFLENRLGMIYYHTGGDKMTVSKIAITIDDNTLKQIDVLVKSKLFPNRSKAIQEAITEKLMRLEKRRLAQECAMLDPEYEQSLAEEGLSSELEEWPAY